MAVIVLIESSEGENNVLAIRSESMQNRAPVIKTAGIITIGLLVLKMTLVICGTAMPTKDTGPAKATTQEDKIPVISTSMTFKSFVFTPRLLEYASPSIYAPTGFDIKKIIIREGITMQREIYTSCHDEAEKLPIDQCVRLTISSSLAKFMRRSVSAEQIYPVIIPAMRRTGILFALKENKRTISIEIKDPIKDENTLKPTGIIPITPEKTTVQKARNILAPDEIPSTKGPAIGFLKNVWIKKPESDNAPPKTKERIILGILIFIIILQLTASLCVPKTTPQILSKGRLTLPIQRLSTNAAPVKSVSKVKETAYLKFLRVDFIIFSRIFIISDDKSTKDPRLYHQK